MMRTLKAKLTHFIIRTGLYRQRGLELSSKCGLFVFVFGEVHGCTGRIVDTFCRFAVNCLSMLASYLCGAFYDILKAIDSESVGSEVLLVIVG